MYIICTFLSRDNLRGGVCYQVVLLLLSAAGVRRWLSGRHVI